MNKTINDLVEAGYSLKEILEAVKDLRKNESIRCDSCNKRLADVEDGEIIIKCRCGELHKIS